MFWDSSVRTWFMERKVSTTQRTFVTFQEQHSHTRTQDYYLMGEEECAEADDIEVPKALGDILNSWPGPYIWILECRMSLDAVWRVYYRIMKNETEQFSQNVPKSPIRELLELEPETAKFGKPEKLWDGRRVTVEIFGVGTFCEIGPNYRIAKCKVQCCQMCPAPCTEAPSRPISSHVEKCFQNN